MSSKTTSLYDQPDNQNGGSRIDTADDTGELLFDGELANTWSRDFSGHTPRQSSTKGSDIASRQDPRRQTSAILAKLTPFIRQRIVSYDFEGFDLDALCQEANLNLDQQEKVQIPFKDNIELIDALIQEFYYPIFADISDAACNQTPVPERLLLIAQRHLQRLKHDPELALVITDLLVRSDSRRKAPRALIDKLDAIHAQAVKVSAGLVAEGQLRGEVRSGDPFVLAMVLLTALYGLLNILDNPISLVNKGINTDELALQVFEIAISGLQASTT